MSTQPTLEQQLPGVMESGLITNKDVQINANLTVTGTTNIAAVSLTDLTVTGNTVIGNAVTDTLAVTGLTTFTNNTLSTNKAITVTTSSASTSGATSVEPVHINTTMTGAGGVGGRFKSSLTANVALGAWSNAIKGEVTYGASGSTSGLGSAIVSEMTLSAGTASGTYAPMEIELNLGSGALTGTATSLIYGSVNGADAGTFDTNGFILNLAGLTAGASNVFRTGLTAATINAATTAALRIKIGSTTYYIPLATATA